MPDVRTIVAATSIAVAGISVGYAVHPTADAPSAVAAASGQAPVPPPKPIDVPCSQPSGPVCSVDPCPEGLHLLGCWDVPMGLQCRCEP